LEKTVLQNEAPKQKQTPNEATETPLLQKVTQADEAFKTLAAVSLDTFWTLNPQVAANKEIFLQTFACFGNFVAGTKAHDEQAAEREAALAKLDEEALEAHAYEVELREMAIQQEKEANELAQKMQNDARLQQEEVLRQQKLNQIQAAQELNAQQELDKKKLLEKQKSDPPQAPSLFDKCKAEIDAKAGVGQTIQMLEAQLAQSAQRTRTLEGDKVTAEGMEIEKSEDQDAKKPRKEQ